MNMKKLFMTLLAALLLSSPAIFAQSPINSILDRFVDQEKGRTVFLEKGHRAIGISGGYRSFNVGGEDPLSGDGYSILSLLNIGNGKFRMYNVSPSFSYFLADDLSLGIRLDYSGYLLDTDLKLDLRDISEYLPNLQVTSRHYQSNVWGGSLSLRKYLSFFGSRTFGVFGEARLYGNYGRVVSCPLEDLMAETGEVDEYGEKVTVNTGKTVQVTQKQRVSDAYGVGLKLAVGLCVKLRDNSAIVVSLPVVGVGYSFTKQFKNNTGNTARMSQFNISRELDYMSIQIGYTRYIKSKKR